MDLRDPSIRRVAIAVLAIKGYTLVLLYLLSNQVTGPADYGPFLFLDEGETREARLSEIRESFVERLAPYDGQYYLDITHRGYRRLGRADPNSRAAPGGNFAFFPLFPALLRMLGFFGHEAGLALALLLNVLFSASAAVGVYLLARRVGAPPWWSVAFLVAFPTAVFQSVLYTESLFLLLSVGVALGAESGRRWPSAALGFLAGLCRAQGILVGALGLGGLWRRERAPKSRRGLQDLLVVLAPFAGLAVFAAILAVTVGEPLGFLSIQKHWDRGFSVAQLASEVFGSREYVGPPFDLLALVFGIGMVPFLWRRLPAPLALYGTLSVALPLSTGTVLSFGRFISVSYPHFLCLAMLLVRWPVTRSVTLVLFIALQFLVAKGLMAWLFVG